MAVAQLRGIQFTKNIDGLHGGDWMPTVTVGFNVDKAHKALRDVYEWLGYGEVVEYLDAMYMLREKIFDRAKY